MKRILTTATALAAVATTVQAGGVERSTQSVAILFEQGRYAELSFGNFSPDVSGSILGGARQSGDMAPSYNNWSLGYKMDIGERMALAVIIDEPIGADVAYPGSFPPGPYPLAGSTAELNSSAITALLRYKFANDFSVHGGLRYQTVEGQVSLLGRRISRPRLHARHQQGRRAWLCCRHRLGKTRDRRARCADLQLGDQPHAAVG